MILGPKDGFLTTLLSVLLGHTLVFRDSVYEYIFTLGAPIGSFCSGLVYKGERVKILIYYLLLLGSYFMSPVSRALPIWGMWDVYMAFIVLIVITLFEKALRKNIIWHPKLSIVIGAFIGLEADILFRIFVLVPLRGYKLFYGLSYELLTVIWSVPAPLITPVKVSISLLLSVILIPSINKIFKNHAIAKFDHETNL
jgi:hypothetical protein